MTVQPSPPIVVTGTIEATPAKARRRCRSVLACDPHYRILHGTIHAETLTLVHNHALEAALDRGMARFLLLHEHSSWTRR
jgi:hypothetical protein